MATWPGSTRRRAPGRYSRPVSTNNANNKVDPAQVQALVDEGDAGAARALAQDALVGLAGTERGRMLLALSTACLAAGDKLESLRAAVAASESFKAEADAAGECEALTRLSVALRMAGDHASAISTLEQAESMARALGDPQRLANTLRNMGVCCSLVGQHHHALSCLDEAATLLAAHGTLSERLYARLSACNGRNRLAESLPATAPERHRMLDALLADWQALADDCAGAGQRRIELMARGNRAITLAQRARHAEAAFDLQRLLDEYRALGMRPNEGLCLAELGRCHLALENFAAAREHLQQAVQTLTGGGALDDLLSAWEALSDTEEVLGNASAALAALRQVREIERRRSNEAARAVVTQRELRIELARLTSQWARHATQDPLTGLANRRGLDLWLDQQLPRALHGQALSVLLLDLDHFKWVNDSFGHATGDEVLRRVAELLRHSCREGDLAVRYGGEEFVLALTGVDLDAAAVVAERLRERVASQPWAEVAAGLRVTVSIGLAAAVEAEGAPALFTLADRRLYAAKFAGRDRVVVAG